MALTDENGGGLNVSMPVAPAYGNNGGGFGFGNDWSFIIILFLFCMFGGWGGGFGGIGMGGYGIDYLYPWLNNSQNINDGFREQMLNTSVNGIQNAITSGFGDVQTALCGGFAGVNATVNGAQNALAQQLYSNQLADLERSFAAQTATTQGMNSIQSQLATCCCENRAATADVKYTLATEACATSAANTANTQAILDKLCAIELDTVKSQLAAAQRENVSLQNAVNMAAMRESQTAQTAQILAGQAAEIDGVYNRLKNCPVGTYSVCNPTAYTGGCGCGNGFAN